MITFIRIVERGIVHDSIFKIPLRKISKRDRLQAARTRENVKWPSWQVVYCCHVARDKNPLFLPR